MSKIIIVCNGFNSHFFEEISFYNREVTFDNQCGIGLLIGEKEKLFDALVKTIQDNLFKNKTYFSNTDEEKQEFNRQSRNSAVEFVFRQWPELRYNE